MLLLRRAIVAASAALVACSSGASEPDVDPTLTSAEGGADPGADGGPAGTDGGGGGGGACNDGSECPSQVCDPATKTCLAPSPTDQVKNGDETDVDCGGAGAAPRCAAGKTCKAHGDCESDGCAFDGTCASHPSCTKLEGGYTCGATESATKQDDCCASAKVGTVVVDKYLVTAGRMRTFLDRLAGNVRAWAAALPAAEWSQTLTAGLPASWDEANTQLGPFYGKRSCETGYETGHTFWTPATFGDTKDLPQDVLDTKALNCVPWALLSAFCVWDGGHLATEAELLAAYKNAGTTAYPWGAVSDYVTNDVSTRSVQLWGYETPNPPATARKKPNGAYLDAARRIAPPGRRPAGYNTTGHADLVGNLLEWVSDRDRQFIWKGSFENHAREADEVLHAPANNDPLSTRTPDPPLATAPNRAPNQPWQWGANVGTGRPDDTTGPVSSMGYYGIGGRCARAK